MSRRRELQQHLQQLHEIRGILNAMKNLALMETHKLARFLDAQQQAVKAIENIAGDFQHFFPFISTSPEVRQPTLDVIVLFGSERGFCGDFNQRLLQQLAPITNTDAPPTRTDAHNNPATPRLIALGRKLCDRLEHDTRVAARLSGPSVVEEVPTVLNALIDAIGALQARHGQLNLRLVYHNQQSSGQPLNRQLLPPFQHTEPPATYATQAPMLNLPPATFFSELVDHYLFAVLHETIYSSLMAENHRRVEHMGGAVSHLEQTLTTLARRSRSLRQEEITEEIEVILLSAEGLDESLRRLKRSTPGT
ncbi:MAG: F0F1 ATP synthase subunit gamma [Gammaproteobacteria bacterium]